MEIHHSGRKLLKSTTLPKIASFNYRSEIFIIFKPILLLVGIQNVKTVACIFGVVEVGRKCPWFHLDYTGVQWVGLSTRCTNTCTTKKSVLIGCFQQRDRPTGLLLAYSITLVILWRIETFLFSDSWLGMLAENSHALNIPKLESSYWVSKW